MKHIFANWKMYLDYAESVDLADKIVKISFAAEDFNVAVFPNYLAMKTVGETLADKKISIGGQNCAWVPKGAYTGAISALLLKEVGCQYMLVGHSERRYIFGDKDADVRKKIEACLDVNIVPVICIGETKEEKDNDRREYRLKKQIYSALSELKFSPGQIMVAYEPVWAIGTGDSCLPLDVDDVHGWIKQELKKYSDQEIPVLYGGSVSQENVVSYLSLETVDGVLIGSASAKIETFKKIMEAIQVK